MGNKDVFKCGKEVFKDKKEIIWRRIVGIFCVVDKLGESILWFCWWWEFVVYNGSFKGKIVVVLGNWM